METSSVFIAFSDDIIKYHMISRQNAIIMASVKTMAKI